MNLIEQTATLFFPPKPTDPSEMTLKTALDAILTQRIARIAKAAIFALSSIAATLTVVLKEAMFISWPIVIPAMLISLIAGMVFYRLNSLDNHYLGELNDKKRETLAKQELERILLGSDPVNPKDITKSFKDLNRLLGNEIFAKEMIDTILRIHSEVSVDRCVKSIGQAAFDQGTPIILSYNLGWVEEGRYGLPSNEYELGLHWSGNPCDPFEIAYKIQEKKTA